VTSRVQETNFGDKIKTIYFMNVKQSNIR